MTWTYQDIMRTQAKENWRHLILTYSYEAQFLTKITHDIKQKVYNVEGHADMKDMQLWKYVEPKVDVQKMMRKTQHHREF